MFVLLAGFATPCDEIALCGPSGTVGDVVSRIGGDAVAVSALVVGAVAGAPRHCMLSLQRSRRFFRTTHQMLLCAGSLGPTTHLPTAGLHVC